MRIAALDIEASPLDLIRQTMKGIGHECHGFTEARVLLRELRQQSFDLLILEWDLNDLPGPAVVQAIRRDFAHRLPILFVTHRHTEADVIEALAAGADDFMAKPLRVGELKARVQALLRRAYPSQHDNEVAFGPYRFLTGLRTLEINGTAVDLKHREYALALLLFQNLGRLLSRGHLREAVWGKAPDTLSRSLDTHVSRLRAKLDLRPENGFLLSAIYGLGYRLEQIEPEALPPPQGGPACAAA